MKYIYRIKQIKLDDVMYVIFGLYMAALLLTEVCLNLTSDSYSLALKIVRYVCYAFFAIKIFVDWKKGNSVTWSILIVLLCFIGTFLCTDDKSLCFLLLVLLASRKLEIPKLVKINLYVYMVMFFLIVSLSLMKIIPNWQFFRGSIVRHGLGFSYSTVPIGFYLIIILMYFYVKQASYTYTELLMLEFINILIYGYTNGRVGFYLSNLVVTLMIIKKSNILQKCKVVNKLFYSKLLQKSMKIMCFILPSLFLLTSYVLSINYDPNNEVYAKLNQVLSERLEYSNKALKMYKLTIFGEEHDWKGYVGNGIIGDELITKKNYNYVDTSYLRIMLDNGILIIIIAMISYTWILVKCWKQQNLTLLSIFVIILIFGLIEPSLMQLTKNVFLLEFIPLLNLKKIKKLDYESIKNYLKV